MGQRESDMSQMHCIGFGGIVKDNLVRWATSAKELVLVAMLLGIATLAGCGGGSDLERYRVYGTVSYDGKPLPYGRIVFEADGARGNHGPQGFALIEHGAFDTDTNGGKGTIGGPHITRISGFDGISTNEDAPFGNPLFRQFEQEVDLPRESTELNVSVPISNSGR
jgi:hypothetical protein